MNEFVGQGLPDDIDPDSPADEGMSATDDVAADDVGDDTQADDVAEDAETDAEADEAEGEDDGTGEEEEEDASPTFTELLKKYKGDKEAMAQAYVSQANSLSDLTREVREVKEFIKGQQKQPEVLTAEERNKRISESPDVVEVSEELESIRADYKDEDQSLRAATVELGKLEKEVARLEGKLESAYDENKPAISAELASAQSRHERALEKVRSADRNKKKLEAQFNRTQRRMEKAQRMAEAEIDREIKQKRADVEAAESVRAEFADAMIAEAKELGIAPNSARFRSLFDTVQSRLWAYTRTLPDDADPIDIPVAVKQLVGDIMENIGGRTSFHKQSKAKRQAALGKAPTRQATPPTDARPTKKGKRTVQDAAYWDRRAKRLLGG